MHRESCLRRVLQAMRGDTSEVRGLLSLLELVREAELFRALL